ncbi:MAG: MMPL family transporter [Candidatus Aminicenantes bacterium]|nr:MAG: MMPL family transporter [Candidatus Aminicenantes bacterium]
MKKFGEFILKHNIILILVIVGVSVLFFLRLPELRMEDDETTWFPSEDPVHKAYKNLKETFVGSEFVVISYESDNLFSESEIEYLSTLSQELERVHYVTDVSSLTSVEDIVGTELGLEIKPLIQKIPKTEVEFSYLKKRIDLNPFFRGNLISNDARTIGIVLKLYLPDDAEKPLSAISEEVTVRIKEILNREQEKTGRTFYLGGSIITDTEIQLIMERDISIFFPLSMLLTGLVLLIIFRSLSSIIFPIITVFLALIWTLGLKGIVDSPITPVSTTLFALLTVIGIANSVHLISHYRSELPLQANRKQALLESYRRAGKPCFFTSLTTAVGFGSLVVSRIPAIRSLGIFASFGIMSAFILSMILVPVGLLLTQLKFNPAKTRRHKQVMMGKIGAFNLKHPRWILLAGFLIILIMGIGITRIRVEPSMVEYLKKNTSLRKDAEFLDEKLSGISSIEVVLTGEQDSFKNPDVLRKIENLQEMAEDHPNVPVSYSIVTFLKLINRALNSDQPEYFRIPETREGVAQSLLLYEMSGGTEIEDFTTIDYEMVRISMRTNQMKEEERKKLIERIFAYAETNFSSFKVDITGFDNLVHEVTERITMTQIHSFGLAFLVILGFMFLLFGLRGGLLSIIPNIFPIVFVLGLMGYAGFNLNIATAIIASIAIGIVVDDTIHYFTHFKYEFQESGERKTAMKQALQKVGPALCFTSVILALGFLIHLLSETRILFDFGILASLAVVMALLGDLFIGPTLLVQFRIFKK